MDQLSHYYILSSLLFLGARGYLGEYCGRHGKKLDFSEPRRSGESHLPIFEVTATSKLNLQLFAAGDFDISDAVNGRAYGTAHAQGTKKKAKEYASLLTLQMLSKCSERILPHRLT